MSVPESEHLGQICSDSEHPPNGRSQAGIMTDFLHDKTAYSLSKIKLF